uniref:Putative exonuclease n=1 Tax=Chlorobium chlorochromatii (strain CaD3) TaxID=340177 RepID=Q3ARM0_CHLCH
MFTFLHVADLHLDSPLKGLEEYPDAPLKQLRHATRRAFDNVVQMALDERVAFVVVAGDLYDTDWRDYNTGLFFVSRMAKLREAGIPVIIVSGNHDAASQITRSLRLPDNVKILSHTHPESYLLEPYNVAIHGQSFATRFVRDDLARNYPQADPSLFTIGLLHTSLETSGDVYAPTTLDLLRSKGYNYWALGHMHRHEVVHRNPWVVYTGNIQGRHIREGGAKGCMLVTVENDAVVQTEWRAVDVLRWARCAVLLEGCDSMEQVYHLVRERMEELRQQAEGRPLALRVQLRGATPLHHTLHTKIGHVMEEIRAIAVSFGDCWLEKVELELSAPHAKSDLLGAASPLASLLEAVDALELPDGSLTSLLPDFEKLRHKLPHELISDGDPFAPPADELEILRDEVKQLLSATIEETIGGTTERAIRGSMGGTIGGRNA